MSMLGSEKTAQLEVSVIPPRVRAAMESIPIAFTSLSESELVSRSRPTWIDQALRASFWSEYERACRIGTNMVQTNVFRGVCEEGTWFKTLKNPMKCAFIFRPLVEYQKAMETLLTIGINRVHEILHMPIYDDKTGKPDARIAGIVLQAVKQVEDRVKGMAVQRIFEKQERVSSRAPTPTSLSDIDSKIKMLEAELGGSSEQAGIPAAVGTEADNAPGIAAPVRDEMV